MLNVKLKRPPYIYFFLNSWNPAISMPTGSSVFAFLYFLFGARYVRPPNSCANSFNCWTIKTFTTLLTWMQIIKINIQVLVTTQLQNIMFERVEKTYKYIIKFSTFLCCFYFLFFKRIGLRLKKGISPKQYFSTNRVILTMTIILQILLQTFLYFISLL